MPGSGPKDNIPELNAISRRGWWSEIRYQVQQWQDALHGEKHRLYQTSREALWTPWSLDCERTVGLWPCWKRPRAGSSFNGVHPRANGAHLQGTGENQEEKRNLVVTSEFYSDQRSSKNSSACPCLTHVNPIARRRFMSTPGLSLADRVARRTDPRWDQRGQRFSPEMQREPDSTFMIQWWQCEGWLLTT